MSPDGLIATQVVLALLLAFLLGSIPFGLLLTRAAGLGDIRSIGSGNIGATNVLRTGHKGIAAATLLLDFLKGTVAVWLVAAMAGWPWAPLAAIAAVLGHCHPPWLGFKGGKAVATALGVMLGLHGMIFVVAGLTWLLVAAVTRTSSLSSLASVAVAPVVALAFAGNHAALALLVVALYVAWRHKGNIQRLLAGTEPRIGQGK
ncbi:glycerol-3-phosphate 1-O-acyltransferase PlsY [Roseococcus sp. YIM B11640]|uniref:glycerol-3-phosphate 1-O-acyltransferase PlsY n=1 Tax=Roseococcus sp. YIM B11640 TaxID=3133973 RepID=UPI003C79C02B